MLLLALLIYLAPGTLTPAIPHFSPFLSTGFTDARTYPHNINSSLPLPLTFSRDVLDSTCTCPSQQQRSVWDIIWSCLAVIFACSWVSVHPDVPAPEEKWWRNYSRRIEYLFWTLITPELIICWAGRQWIGARKIEREQREHGWTVTHGHFIQMGGFMLFKGNERIGTLSYPGFRELIRRGQIQYPDITQKEIEDRSKSDGLSKTLVIAQTGWFVMQCIARAIRGLPITELELLTLALAALNGFMYFFWWNKPFDVQCPVPVHLIPTTDSKISMPVPTFNINKVTTDFDSKVTTPEPKADKETAASPSPDYLLQPERAQQNLLNKFHHFFISLSNWSGWKKLLTSPWTAVLFIWSRFGKMGGHTPNREDFEATYKHLDNDTGTGTPLSTCVPIFYSLEPDHDSEDDVLIIVIPLIGSLYGLIHCAGWARSQFQCFPTDAERWLWRVSSVIITIVPIEMGIAFALVSKSQVVLARRAWRWFKAVTIASSPGIWWVRATGSWWVRAVRRWLARASRTVTICLGERVGFLLGGLAGFGYVVGIVVLVALPLLLYFPARLVLLAEAISTLRELPPEAFEVVQWTAFIPHI